MDTRDRLIETARNLFLQNGYGNTGIAQLLKAADVGSGSLYHFFPTKEDLLLAVLEKYKDLLWPMVIQPVFDRVSDPVERIFAILAGYRLRILSTNCQYGCPLGRLALEIDPENRPAHALIAENFRGWIGAVRQCVEEARDRLRPETDPDALATYVLAVMEGGVMLARSYGAVEPFDQTVSQLREHFRLLARA